MKVSDRGLTHVRQVLQNQLGRFRFAGARFSVDEDALFSRRVDHTTIGVVGDPEQMRSLVPLSGYVLIHLMVLQNKHCRKVRSRQDIRKPYLNIASRPMDCCMNIVVKIKGI